MRIAVAVTTALVLAASPAPARADGPIGLVVTGDAGLDAKVAKHVERWLTKHGHTVAPDPLSADATVAIDNCLVVNDPTCARGVVEARGQADSIVFVHVEAKQQNVSITAYWFVKGREPIGERRGCEHCGSDGWHGVADTMMEALVGAPRATPSKVKIGSKPSGLIVLLDNAQIGITPIEREVPPGHHDVKLLRAGHQVGERQLDIAAGETKRVTIQARISTGGGGSRLGPLLMLIAGGATLGTGLGFIYVGERSGPDQKYVYPDSTPVGIGLTVVGAGAALGGIIWLAQSSGESSSSPTISLGPTGASVGWFTRF